MAFDRRSGRIVLVADAGNGAETWTFDVCTNTWTRMYPDREPSGDSLFGQMVYDIDSDVTIAFDGARVWAYDLQLDAWTAKGPAPTADPRFALRFYDPVGGLVVATGDDGDPDTPGVELWSYEVETDTWTPVPQANRLAVEPREYAYDASVARLVVYANAGEPAEASTWLFDLRTATWSATGAITPQFSYGWFGTQPVFAYDEAAERTVMLGQGHSAAYDASTDSWETLYAAPATEEPGACGTRPECRQMANLVYDALNERLVVFGGAVYTGCLWETPDDAWALDVATNSWTLVVPPTPVLPPMRDLTAGGAPAPTGPDRSPWIRATGVRLHGGPFNTRVAGVADGPWSSTPQAAADSIVDGLFLPECQLWTDGTVWWEETTSDPSARAWIEIDLGSTYAIDSAVIQADVNDEYLLSYRDGETAEWVPLWNVPFGEAGGMATRPQQGNPSLRWPLARPVVTDALRFEATSGDAQYSVSEIAVFGVPAP
jgi:hypothetical protein